MMFRCVLTAAVLALTPLANAQAQETIEETMEALYASISGPVGAPRDFDTLRALFLDGAVMGIAGPGPEGTGRAGLFSVEEYITRNGESLVSIGFSETETARRTWVYGELATVHSAYVGTRLDTGAVIATGINVLTLARVEEEWKIASILWRPADEAWPVERGFEE